MSRLEIVVTLYLRTLSPMNMPSLTIASTSASTMSSVSSSRARAGRNTVAAGAENSEGGAGVETCTIVTHLHSSNSVTESQYCTVLHCTALY